MATTTDPQQLVATKLATIELMLTDLPELAEQWGSLGVDERMSWSLDWSNDMSVLAHLGKYASAGLLPQYEQARYDLVVQTLRGSRPTIERLNLYCPRLPLES